MKATKSQGQSTGRGYWSSRSDAELLSHDFYTADPSKLDNLLNSVPVTDEVPQVEFTYNTLLTGTGQVRCIHCKVNAVNHNRGFVLRFADGTRMLFGRNCGENVYGEEFGLRRLDFDTALKRHGLLKRRQHIVVNRNRLIGVLEQIEAHPSWRAFSMLKRGFLTAFPDIATEITEAAERRDGLLYGDQQVRDTEAEAAYEKRHGRSVLITKRVSAVVHQLMGNDFFSPRRHPDSVVPDLCKRATNAIWTLGDGDKTNNEIEAWLRGMGGIVTALRDEASRFKDLPSAFSQANIDGISHWMRSVSLGNGELRLASGRLYRTNRKGEVREFYPSPESYEPRRAEMSVPEAMPEPPKALIEDIADVLVEGIAEQIRR